MLEAEEEGAMLFAELGVFIAWKLRCTAILLMADNAAKLFCSHPQQNLKLSAGCCGFFGSCLMS
jgi:hypothetical protein